MLSAILVNSQEGTVELRQFEVVRFTRQEHEHGDTAGWRFDAGWFRRMSGLEWAWFSREITLWKW